MGNTQMLICLAGICCGYTTSALGQTVAPGDIVITEFMPNPSSTLDSKGEYIEIYNRRSIDLDITGFILSDDGSDHHVIENGSSLVIPSESFLLLAVSAESGTSADYVYAGITLSNSGDEIILSDSLGFQIARVTYSSSQVSAGSSLELTALSHINGQGEADASHYMDAVDDIGNGDLGSPGLSGTTDLTETPTIRLRELQSSAAESTSFVEIDVMIEDPDSQYISVSLNLREGESTAEAEDLTTDLPQVVTFNSEATDGQIKTIVIEILDDSLYEGDEAILFYLKLLEAGTNTRIAGDSLFTLTIADDDFPVVVINEIHADPDPTLGDADGNGIVNSGDDEFVEIINTENVSVHLGGWSLSDQVGVRYTFSEDAVLPAHSAWVIFGGFEFQGDFGGALVSGTGTLSLNNSGDQVVLKDDKGLTIDSLSYGSEGGKNEALVRDPEFTGPLSPHSTATESNGALYSPGIKANGQFFAHAIYIEGNAGWRMLAAPVEPMPIAEIRDDVPIQGFGDGLAKNFYTGYNGTAFTAPVDLTGEIVSGQGFILYFFNNNKADSRSLPVSIDLGAGNEPTEDVTVALHSNGDGWNLLGNPYQTAFDLSSILPVGGNLSSSVAQFWSNAEGSYILSSMTNNKVASGQGFFLQNSDASAVNLPVSGKASGTLLYKEIEPPAFIQLALHALDENGEKLTDKSIVLYFHKEACGCSDAWDVEKLIPLESSYAILSISGEEDDRAKAQDSRSLWLNEEELFQLSISTKQARSNLKLSWVKSAHLPDNWVVTFRDHKTGSEIPMDSSFSYSFGLSKDQDFANAASKLLAGSVKENITDQVNRFSIRVHEAQPTSSDRADSALKLRLYQNYPNPFNPSTYFNYQLSRITPVRLTVYDITGKMVQKLIDEVQGPGSFQVQWSAKHYASGIYYYRLEAEEKILTKKMTLIK